uniref:Uncharacterized protein n=1 Tax=Pinctada fucata TaxID=50426 RepID=A0A194ANF1_PINFU
MTVDFKAAKASYNAFRLAGAGLIFVYFIALPRYRLYQHEQYMKERDYPKLYTSAWRVFTEGRGLSYIERPRNERIIKFGDGAHEDIHLE